MWQQDSEDGTQNFISEGKIDKNVHILELFKASSLNHLLILIISLIDHKGAEYSGFRSQSVTLRSTLEDLGKTFTVTLQF